MSRMKGLFCALIPMLMMTPTLALETPQVTEEVTVTATRTETATRNLSQEVRVIDRDELEASGSVTVDQVLQSIPGILVNRSGGAGSPASIYLRGAKPGHTVVMVDGIKLNDTMSTDRSVDLSSLLVDSVKRIEIVYGPAASTYGSDAMAGVINIITTGGAGSGGTVRVEAGSLGTATGGFRWHQQGTSVNFWIGASYFTTDGVSAASEADGNTEADGYINRTINGGMRWDTGNGTLSLTAMIIDGRGDLDNFGGPFGDSPDYTFDREETHLRVDYTVSDPFGFEGQSRLTFTSSENDRHYSNNNPNYPPLVESSYDGRLDTLTWHSVAELDRVSLGFGVEHARETGESDYESDGYMDHFARRHVGTDSLYVTGLVDWLGCQWNGGLRLDDHDIFGGQTTGSIGVVKLFPDSGLRLRVHGGTAFKAPSLYQLYSPYGSVALTPEESRSMEIGLEKSLAEDRLLVSLTWFDSRYDDMIDFDPDTWTYINVAQAAIRGSEIAFQYRQHDTGWRLAYNFYHTEDRVTGETLLRRPRATITGAFHTRWNRLGCHLELTYNNSRDDFDYSAWPAARVELDPFILLDVAFSYRIRKNMEAVFRGQNITDETYELVKGYGTPGSTWYAGIRLTMQQ